MRPDGLEQAETPFLDRLRSEGAFTGSARSVMPSITLPCHMSMLRGVDVTRHGVTTNTYQPPARPVPSLLDVAKEKGRRTGFFYNWEELRDLHATGKLDVSFLYWDCEHAEGDHLVADMTISFLERLDLEVVMVYLGYPDIAGHHDGWMSQPYLDSLTNADGCIARIYGAFERLGLADDTVTLVTSDHGGHGRSHGTDCDEDLLIPWLLHGPGIRAGHALETPVRIYDTCTTLAHILGLPPSPEWDGQVVTEALMA
jgi:predicted AlkP superfamily pyrophosphatase or phosphodiesterase